MYLPFPQAEPLEDFNPSLLPLAGRFRAVVGHSFFGDLFLRDPETKECGILIASTLEIVDTGEVDEHGFREQILTNPEIVQTMLRPGDAAALARRLGMPALGEAFIPVPIPALGGSGDLSTFEKGGLREYLAIVAQSMGIRAERDAAPDRSGM
jgi:hypothetical protein